MRRIRVDTCQLRTEAGHLDSIRAILSQVGRDVTRVAASLPSYDGQLSGLARTVGMEADSRVSALAAANEDHAQQLIRWAGAFETADSGPTEWWQRFVARMDSEISDLEHLFNPLPISPPAVPAPPPASMPLLEPTPTAVPESTLPAETAPVSTTTPQPTTPILPSVIAALIANPDAVDVNAKDGNGKLIMTIPNGASVDIPFAADGKPVIRKLPGCGDTSFLLIRYLGQALYVKMSGVWIPSGPFSVPTDSTWDPNSKNGTIIAPGDNDFGLTQFINLGFLGGTSLHHALCGELVILHLAGQSLREGFTTLDKSFHKKFTDPFNPVDTTDALVMLGLFHKQADVFPVGKFPPDNLTPEFLQNQMMAGKKFMVLAYLDDRDNKNPDYMLDDPSNIAAGPHGHWTDIESVWKDSAGTDWVKIYNPYHNEYEAYTWGYFKNSMLKPGKGNPPTIIVIP